MRCGKAKQAFRECTNNCRSDTKSFFKSQEFRGRDARVPIVLDMDNDNHYPLAIHGEGVPA